MPARRKKLNRKFEPEELVQDPYCQTYVPKRSAVKKKIAGRLLYFCNQECMENYINGIKKKNQNRVDKVK
jgi:YHS domain-containing protein